MRTLWLAALAIVGCWPAYGVDVPAGLTSIAVETSPREIAPGKLNGLRLLGSQVLHVDDPRFGGISGLEVGSGYLLAVGDRGLWLSLRVADGPTGLVFETGEMAQMRDADGLMVGTAAADAEGLAIGPAGTFVSFERDHRIMRLAGGELMLSHQHRAFERMSSNKGLEALAPLPDGRLLAISEGAGTNGFRVFVIGGEVLGGTLPKRGRHLVTGADVGPDGKLYVLKRDYSFLAGVSIQVVRYHLRENGLPAVATAETLAAFESESGIDNMEGISVWRDARGRLRMTLISDDNFSLLQRTLLMDFVVDP